MSILFKKIILVMSLIVGLNACGGSSSDPGSSATTTTLSGTAATGAALASKVVTVVDADGNTVTTVTDVNGKFIVTVTAAAKPYMLKVETAGDPLYSYASEGGGIVNITPMTNLALHEANKNGSTYVALSSLFSTFQDHFNEISEDDLNDAKAKVNATLATLLTASGVNPAFDVFTTDFDADQSGIDAVLDNVEIIISAGGSASNISMTINGSTFTFDPEIDFSNFLPGSESGSESATLPASVSGEILNMVFGSAQAGAPYNNADVVKFTFSSSGALMLTEQFTEFASTFTEVNDTTYQWDNGTHTYALSLLNGVIHEVNISDSATNAFLGQFVPGSTSSASNGVSFSVAGEDLNYTAFASQKVAYGTTDVVELVLDNSGANIKIPREVGTHNCNLSIPGTVLGTSTSAGACSIDVTSVSPLIATFSGKVQGALFPFADVDLTNGSVYLDTEFVSSNSSTIDDSAAFVITYGGVALNANTCDPSVLVTPTASTLLGGFNSDVYGWTGDADEASAFYEFSLNKAGNTSTPGQVNFRFVCANLNISWQTSGTLAGLGISLDTSSGLVNFNNTVIPFVPNGITTTGFPTDTTIIPRSSLSITLNGTLAEI